MSIKKRVAVGFVAFALSCAWVVRAEEGIERPSWTEGYAGLIAPYNSLGGDLDGDRGFVNIDGLALVPEPDPGLGFGAVLGLKHNSSTGRAFAIEVSAQRSRHDTKFAGVSGDANFDVLSGDVKLFPTTGKAVEPWVQVGLCLARLEYEDAFLETFGGTKDAAYVGGGFNAGLGILGYVSDRVALHLAAIYRHISYNEVDYGEQARLDDDLDGNTISVELGVTLRFNRK